MLLTPHHFQQWDNYHEELLNSRVSAVAPFGYGVLETAINREAIANGNFQMLTCRAVLPDGLVLDVPNTDAAPNPRPIGAHFSPEAETLGVHLAIPVQKFNETNYQASGGKQDSNLRFWQEGMLVKDETSGTNEQPLALARSNLRILFDDELRDGYTAIKIAQLERTATGQPTISETYIPPILNVTASIWLANMLRQLLERIIYKSSSLADQRRQRNASLADFTTSEVAVFWLLNTVNASVPAISHLFRAPLVHPERLYLEMAGLAGRLMTFSTQHHPKDIVKYDHDDLYFTFSQLSEQIFFLLEAVIPTRCVPIPLEKVRETLYIGRVQDDRLLKEAAFYLGVKANMPVSRVIEGVPRVIKIAARDAIEVVVGNALPGVVLSHTSPPPGPIPARIDFQYFNLDTVNPYWEGIKGAKVIAIYVPDDIPDEKLELFAVKP